MGSLLTQINESADLLVAENIIVSNNLDLLTEYLSMPTDQLNEAISTWLARVRNAVSTNKLNPDEKENTIKILGALAALSNRDLADAFDVSGKLGTILSFAGDSDKKKSNAGLQQLLNIGREPSVKTFVDMAAKAIEDPNAIELFTNKIQAKIEPIMNKKLAIERGKR